MPKTSIPLKQTKVLISFSDNTFLKKLWICSCVAHKICHFNHLNSVTYNHTIVQLITTAAAAAAKLLQSCLALCDPIDGSLPGSSVPGILQQEHCSGLPFPSPMHKSKKWKWSRSVCPTLRNPIDCSLPGSSVPGILQAGVLEWGAIAFSCCCCWVASVVSDSVRPHRWQPTRLCHPWDSTGKNTGVGCHFLLQCMKVKSESEVAQSCLTLATLWTAAYQAPPSMGFSRQEYWSGVPLPSRLPSPTCLQNLCSIAPNRNFVTVRHSPKAWKPQVYFLSLWICLF